MLEGQPAQRVAVIERLGAGLLQRADRADVGTALSPTRRRYSSGSERAQHLGLLHRQPGRDVAVQRVVRGGLVGDDVHVDATSHELGQHLSGVAEQPDRQRPAVTSGRIEAPQRIVQIARPVVQVAGLDPSLDRAAGRSRCRAPCRRTS